ncbi:hypothetical protein [Flavobacterium sp. MDT1-60]|uniref:hypothetical protein n=1 Tax=Flavobacterium sp. MDT1-60 TaxID=1979344 RepID=UPI0017835F22|nr:hypothetical protein [Flavobacterium sp. MDT1-60]QOG01000.1 hypothetical protein IHE43_14370 [Flavobacterium sp. MDT1-60]
MKIVKLNKFLIITFLSITALMKAQDSVSIPKKAKVYFLRSTGFVGSGASFKTYIDGELVSKLSNKKYSIHEVSEGKHECYVLFGGLKINEKVEKCEIEVQPNKITYVQFFLDNGILGFKIYCKEITEEDAKKKIEKMKEEVKYL